MDTRTQLLHQALGLWSARGYEAVGVQELCDAGGVSKPTLYHHFGSKAGLLDALLQTWMSPYRTLVHEAAAYRHDLVKNLQDLTLGWFAQVRARPDFARLYLMLGAAGRDSEPAALMRQWTGPIREDLVQLFTLAAQDHGNMRQREQRYAASFQGQLDAYTRLHVAGDLVLEDQLVYPVVHQFMHGIFS